MKQGPDASKRFLAQSLGLVVIGVFVMSVLGIVGAPALVWMFASGLASDPATFALGVELTRWLFPYVYFVSLVALAMGALNAHGRFAAPAAAPVFLNISWVAATLLLADRFERPIFVLVVGVLIGGVVQVLLQIPALWRAGLLVLPSVRWRTPEVQELLRRLGPQLFGLAVYQLNIIILRQFRVVPAGRADDLLLQRRSPDAVSPTASSPSRSRRPRFR